jgi:hypothetical protein
MSFVCHLTITDSLTNSTSQILINRLKLRFCTFILTNKMKNKKYYTVRTVPNWNRKIVVRVKIVTTKHIYTRPHTFLALYRHFSKKWRSKQVLLDLSSALSEMMRSCKICPYASKMPTGIVALVVFLVGCLDHRHTDLTCL